MAETELNVRQIVLPYLAVLVVLNIALQTVITLADNEIGVASFVATIVVAAFYGWFQVARRSPLSQIRFGRLVAHVCGFVTVNLGFHAHAAMLIVTNNPAIRGDADFPIDEQWFGVLFGMFVIWGLGLLIHVTASVYARGFEDLHA